jgi:hypothetical protein
VPSRKIISSCAQIVQQTILPQIPSKWRAQCTFGIQAFTLKPFCSLASNARQTEPHPDTAATKVERLVRNERLANHLGASVARLGYIRPDSLVNCDHSDFNGLTAFVGAVQTKRGRAIPCLLATTYAQGLPAHNQASKRKQQLRAARQALDYDLYDQVRTVLQEFAEVVGFWPRFVFDRGFMSLELVELLTAHQAQFYIRLKAGRIVELSGKKLRVDQLGAQDSLVRLHDMHLRVVRSDDPQTGEPWYILTSDIVRTRQQIIRIYYYRFEIEETFKDLKHVLGLDQTCLMKPLSLKVLLWFAALSFILAFLAGWWAQADERRHSKKKLSHYKQFFEALRREAYGPPTDLITGGV